MLRLITIVVSCTTGFHVNALLTHRGVGRGTSSHGEGTKKYFSIVIRKFGIVSCYYNREQKESNTQNYKDINQPPWSLKNKYVCWFNSFTEWWTTITMKQNRNAAFTKRVPQKEPRCSTWAVNQIVGLLTALKKRKVDDDVGGHALHIGKDLEVLKADTCCWDNRKSRFRHIFHHHSGWESVLPGEDDSQPWEGWGALASGRSSTERHLWGIQPAAKLTGGKTKSDTTESSEQWGEHTGDSRLSEVRFSLQTKGITAATTCKIKMNGRLRPFGLEFY